MAINIQNIINQINTRLESVDSSTSDGDLLYLTKLYNEVNTSSGVLEYQFASDLPIVDSANEGSLAYVRETDYYWQDSLGEQSIYFSKFYFAKNDSDGWQELDMQLKANTDSDYQSWRAAPASAAEVGLYQDFTVDLASVTYDSVSLSTSFQDDPRGLFFSSDGTKMFMCGPSSDAIYQYTLTTGFDLSTASFDHDFTVTNESSNPTGLYFSPDGTKMFWIGYTADAVYSYTLSTAWDLSTASYDSASFDATSQDASAAGLYFKPDGTKMFVVGYDSDAVYQYSLSTAWDVSTASYDSVSFSVSSQDTSPQGMTFNTQGTQMFVSGTSTDTIYQYSLSTAWDLSTASYDSKSLSVTAQDGFPYNMAFSSAGAKMFLAGGVNDTIFQYSTGL